MKKNHHALALGLSLLAAAAFAPLAHADEGGDLRGWYMGATLGSARGRIDHARITSGLLYGGITTGGMMSADSIEDRDSSTGGKLYGGYRFGPHLSLEGGYVNLGRIGFTANTTPAGSLRGELKASGLALDLLGTARVAGRLSAFGRAGVMLTRVRDEFTPGGAVVVLQPTWSKTAVGAKIGAGLEVALSDTWTVRLEDEVYRIDDAVAHRENVNLLGIGLSYRFGAR